MTTNQTIDGVLREDLELVLIHGHSTTESNEAWDRLRALLEAESVACAQSQVEGKRERFEKWVIATKHPVYGFLDGRSLSRGDDRTGYADEYVQGLWVAYLAFGASLPQGEPVPKSKPVAKLHAERLTGRDGEYGITVEDSQWFNTCRLTGGEFYLYAEQPAPGAVVLDEKDEFVTWVRREWPQAPLSNVRDLLPKDDPRYGEYCDEALQRAWVGWQARAAVIAKS